MNNGDVMTTADEAAGIAMIDQRRPARQRSARLVLALFAAALIAVAIAAAWPASTSVDILQLEFGGSADAAATLIADATGSGSTADAVFAAIDEQLAADRLLILSYTIGLIFPLIALVVLRSRAAPSTEPGSTRRLAGQWPRWSIAGGIAVVAVACAAVFDLIENANLQTGLDAMRSQFPDPVFPVTAVADGPWAVASFAAGTKFALVGLALVVLVSMAATWVATGFSPSPTRCPMPLPDDVRDAWEPSEGKIGVSCSGGGVRSATFSLGALQVLDERGVLPRARYVTAVSGGGYMAASWAVAQQQAGDAERPPVRREVDGRRIDDGATPRPVYAPRSPEERWARLHSSHLVASSLVLLAGALRLVAGILFGWLLIWMLMFAVARPVGWVISSAAVHPELQARTPILETLTQPTLADRPRVKLLEEKALADPPYSLYSFEAAYSCATLRSWATNSSPDADIVQVGLVTTGPGVVRVERGEATVVEQPTLDVLEPTTPTSTTATATDGAVADCGAGPPAPSDNAEGPSVFVSSDAEFELDSRVFQTTPRGDAEQQAELIEQSLRESAAPTISHTSGLTGRMPISFSFGQWLTGLALLMLAFILYLARLLWRPFRPNVQSVLERSAVLSSATGAVWLGVFVVLPWCIQEVPPLLADVLRLGNGTPSSDGATGLDGILAALGISAVLAAAIKAFSEFAVKQGRAHLPVIVKFAVWVLLPLLGALVFLDQLEFAAANGPTGQMLGFGIGMNLAALAGVVTSDAARLTMVLMGLVLLRTIDAHSWSLFPFYKRRLSEAYTFGRTGPDKVAEIPYEAGPILIAPRTAPARRSRWGAHSDVPEPEQVLQGTGHSSLTNEPSANGHCGPELVMCCAANVADADVAPPGRRSVSFSVSREVIGSAELGWMNTTAYFDRLGRRRLSDVTLPSLMAISGAAVSPGMGKMSRGPIDSLLALLNVRLGVWLPNPAAVHSLPAGRLWRGRPWWRWYLREVLGWFPSQAPYLYVSDGGHWENLGLVELFRRGCTEIYCISAAGDGRDSFSTIGEALALARELFGVECEVDLSPLRPPEARAEPVTRSLRRRRRTSTPRSDADATRANTWASSGHVEGTFRYPGGQPNRIVILEANLADGVPWDVQSWAESNEAFPDDPTTDQLFSHRQFESYRALGRWQMRNALAEQPD